MKAIAFGLLAAFTLMLSASTVLANQGPPPKPKTPNPPPPPADPTMPIAGLGAAAGAVALGAWFLRSGTKLRN